MSEPSCIRDARRLVVKVGSALVTNEGRGLDPVAIDRWGAQLARLRTLGKEVVMVSSGAIAEGVKRLGWPRRPSEIHELQAAAAVGQMGLAQVYESCFRAHGLQTAQVLLTHEDLADRTRYLNARSTLVILTDQQGLYTADPRRDPTAKLLPRVVAGDPTLEGMAGGAGSSIGKGGMITKVLAARRAAQSGASTVVCSGREPDVLARLAAGESVGTEFTAQTPRLAARKQWLADHLQLRGAVRVDAGAVRALRDDGKSLLPIGVVEVVGEFERGEAVAVLDTDGRELARGLINYGASDARRIARRPSSEIESLLGWVEEPELIHRDNLVLR
jgi:glutamate 5-kinase